jgi:hypothetical protein
VARLLRPDSSYTLFEWPHPIPESAISVFTNVRRKFNDVEKENPPGGGLYKNWNC